MHRSRITVIAGLAAALSFAAVGCKEEGPAEQAGRAIDEAAENVQEDVQELTDDEGALERAGEEADEAIEEAMEAVEDAID
jgi:hyperosmotically inducible protein